MCRPPISLREGKLREGRGADAGHWLAREHGLASPAAGRMVSEAGAWDTVRLTGVSALLCSFRAEIQLLPPRFPCCPRCACQAGHTDTRRALAERVHEDSSFGGRGAWV